MAFTVTSAYSSNYASGTTTPSTTMPASVAAGDLIFAFKGRDSTGDTGANATWAAGWTKLIDAVATGIDMYIAYKIAAGGETAVICTFATSERSAHIGLRIAAASWHGTTPPEVTAIAQGASANPNSTSLTPSWGSAETLWLSAFAIDAPEAAFPVTAWPTGYADNQLQYGVSGTSAGGIALSTKTATATSDDPAAYTTTGSDNWVAVTIAVRPAVVSAVSIPTVAETLSFTETLD